MTTFPPNIKYSMRILRSGQGALASLRPMVSQQREQGRFLPAGQFGRTVSTALGQGAGSGGSIGSGGAPLNDLLSAVLTLTHNTTTTWDAVKTAEVLSIMVFYDARRAAGDGEVGWFEAGVDNGTAFMKNLTRVPHGGGTKINWTTAAASVSGDYLRISFPVDNTNSTDVTMKLVYIAFNA